MRDAPIRGGALAHAKGRSKKAFDELVAEYRQQGISDAEIVRAMVASPKRLLAGSKQKKRDTKSGITTIHSFCGLAFDQNLEISAR